MRWLLLKDLQILRRSPLQAALLLAYPILIGLLVGFAISREPADPRVALLNEIPEEARIGLGGANLTPADVEERVCAEVDCVRVPDRAAAREEVREGGAIAALVLPEDFVDRLNSLATTDPRTPEIGVLVNEEDPVRARLAEDRITALLAEANLLIAEQIAAEGSRYLDLVVNGGTLDVFGERVRILGLRAAADILRGLRPALPPRLRAPLDESIRFAELARDNLDVAAPLVDRLAQPIVLDRQGVSGAAPPLDAYAIAVAATLTLTFVTVLLVAGSLALEREENAFPRLARGLVGPTALLLGKVGLGVLVGLGVTLLMLAGLQVWVPLEWSRLGLWLVAILAGAAALGAAGAALGAAAREAGTVSLLAFMVALPVALLSLVPAGAVGEAPQDAIDAIAAAFPFKPALTALTGALEPAGPSLAGPLLHLLALAAAYGLLARLALRRF